MGIDKSKKFQETINVRLDAWLYSVRIFKTRLLAKESCSKGHVKLNGQKAKPSQKLTRGIVVEVNKDHFWRTFEVLDPIQKRVGAKELSKYLIDRTDLEKLKQFQLLKKMSTSIRPKGRGRPTKKERRSLDKFSQSLDNDFSSF